MLDPITQELAKDKPPVDGETGENGTAADEDSDDWEDQDDGFVDVKASAGLHHRNIDNRLASVQNRLPFSFHPNFRPLTISDLDSCEVLENGAFENPAHRCTREKFEYRLTACPEICFGVFCTILPEDFERFQIDTFPTSHAVETRRENGGRSVLVAHIVATKSDEAVVTDAAMGYPRDFRARTPGTSLLGHDDTGRTVCIHSLAVHPRLQSCGLGKCIVKSYLQHVQSSGFADRCALICQDYLVSYYEKLGFSHMGPSSAGFGGGGWNDMVLDFDRFHMHMPEIKI
ncbi:hypothetical protein GGS23DRAFT_42570 [Durotheca rogersii]|uniref:uncharacterized protein n=1 Tax=Durotheca rogersii TaxID=419775 RepID=UPI0022205224|nr:uncharacterized protein GGS23DRAFT_42570 [Durotheca rogersii]KAI5868653.1 hypothetical protein GGS23DRAFT_42570 [Durotheca rogersii]